MLEVKCPRCHHIMKYDPKPGAISGKAKRCVYCGMTFKVHASISTDRIHRVMGGF